MDPRKLKKIETKGQEALASSDFVAMMESVTAHARATMSHFNKMLGEPTADDLARWKRKAKARNKS